MNTLRQTTRSSNKARAPRKQLQSAKEGELSEDEQQDQESSNLSPNNSPDSIIRPYHLFTRPREAHEAQNSIQS